MDSLEDDYYKGRTRNPMSVAILSLGLGIVSVILCLIPEYPAGALVGAVGLVIGGYAVNYVNRSGGDMKQILLVAGALGLFLSMIGFILGFAGML